jgi:phosphinothricin acetyltransferase
MQLPLNGGASVPPDPESMPERKFREGLGGN